MTDIQVGDKVRVIYEGTVLRLTEGFDIQLTNNFHFTTTPLPGRVIEVVEKRKPQVGDRLGYDDFASLPVGSVVKWPLATALKTASGWRFSDGGGVAYRDDQIGDGTLVYVP